MDDLRELIDWRKDTPAASRTDFFKYTNRILGFLYLGDSKEAKVFFQGYYWGAFGKKGKKVFHFKMLMP